MNSDRKKKAIVQLCMATKPSILRWADLKDDLEATCKKNGYPS